jgi:2-amino-4-hydroxy-6-hydroxymethyldihydropteridine diphosphokinase
VAGVDAVSAGDARRVSLVYETEPVGGVAQDDFWNVVVELVTDATPLELLARCQLAERRRGREREVRWGPRTLDADVLLVGDEVSDDPTVLVPHPRMWERRFVLAPLRELRPDLVDERALAAAKGRVIALATLETLR